MTVEETKRFVRDHFQGLINDGDLTVLERNVRSDYIDHNGPHGGADLNESRRRTAKKLRKLLEAKVEIRDILVDGDKVVVRNVWTGRDAESGDRIEVHGFVLFRIQDAQIAERWATITEASGLETPSLTW